MTTQTTPPLTIRDVVLNNLRIARLDLRKARGDFDRSPNSNRLSTLLASEAEVDSLLDALLATGTVPTEEGS